MSKTDRRSASSSSELPILALIQRKAAEEGGFVKPNAVQDPDIVLRKALGQAISACPLSRAQVADSLTELLGRKVGEATLSAWLSESKDGHRFPASYLPAFCRVVGSMAPLAALTEMCGMQLADTATLLLAERARADLTVESARRRRRMIDQALGGEP